MTSTARQPREEPMSLDRSLLSDQVYTRIRTEILDRDLAPGIRIVESELARQLGVSQAPVRDALRRLAHEGLVEQFARRGTFVTEISESEARQTYEVRANLEELAAHEFMANASDADLDELDHLLRQMRAAAADDDVARLVQADAAFHRTIWEASGNVLLPRIWPMVEANFRRLTPLSNRERFGDLMEVANTHGPLLEGLRNGDQRVGALLRAHVMTVWTDTNA
jgi:DNA-binding GntR family transcriptional regulator